MDTQIIVAIITGLFGALVAPLTTQVIIPKLKRRRKDSPVEEKPEQPVSLFLHAGVGGVIGVLLGYFLINPFLDRLSPCPPFAPTKVNITSPVTGTSVPRLVTVQGTACNIPRGRELCLLVLPEGVTAYYPQTGPVVISSDGMWSASAYVGMEGPADIGRGFVLIAGLADQRGSATKIGRASCRERV